MNETPENYTWRGRSRVHAFWITKAGGVGPAICGVLPDSRDQVISRGAAAHRVDAEICSRCNYTYNRRVTPQGQPRRQR